MLRIVRLVTFVVAAVSAAWAIRLEVLGGIHVVVLGHRIRSNNPFHPLAWAFGSAVIFVIAGGLPAVGRAWRRVARWMAVGPVRSAIRVGDQLGRFASARGMAL